VALTTISHTHTDVTCQKFYLLFVWICLIFNPLTFIVAVWVQLFVIFDIRTL